MPARHTGRVQSTNEMMVLDLGGSELNVSDYITLPLGSLPSSCLLAIFDQADDQRRIRKELSTVEIR